jgi:hypothetical protein
LAIAASTNCRTRSGPQAQAIDEGLVTYSHSAGTSLRAPWTDGKSSWLAIHSSKDIHMTTQTHTPGQSQSNPAKKDEQQQQSSTSKQQPGQTPVQKQGDKPKQTS